MSTPPPNNLPNNLPNNGFAKAMLKWFDQHGRKHLPWQQNRSAYRVWVSEIMLQQTQVATVIPYYERFMARFPSVQTLAAASQDDVLQYWAGLGYYARGRNLHKCAQHVVEQYDGAFPLTVDKLVALPGIGRSTAGAVISLSSGQRAVILDGNVKRVLARFHGIGGWPGKTSVADTLWQHAEEHTPKKRCDDFNQAMMDLGATLCTRSKPQCTQCPLQKHCYALAHQQQSQLPGKKPKKATPIKTTQWLVMRNSKQHIYLEQRPPQGIWGGLWSFPETTIDTPADSHCETHYGSIKQLKNGTEFRHTFSHYRLDIQPVIIDIQRQQPRLRSDDKQRWFSLQELNEIGLAAPVKKLLAQLEPATTK